MNGAHKKIVNQIKTFSCPFYSYCGSTPTIVPKLDGSLKAFKKDRFTTMDGKPFRLGRNTVCRHKI